MLVTARYDPVTLTLYIRLFDVLLKPPSFSIVTDEARVAVVA